MGTNGTDWLGVVICLAILVALVAAIVLGLRRKRRTQYDERQLRAQRTAFRNAYFTLVVCQLFWPIAVAMGWNFAILMDLSYGGIFLSLTVWAVSAIFSDAYFAPRQNQKLYSTLYILLAVVNLIPCIQYCFHPDGDYPLVNLTAVLMLSVILVAAGVRRAMLRREEESEP